jgi:hypothetical protein
MSYAEKGRDGRQLKSFSFNRFFFRLSGRFGFWAEDAAHFWLYPAFTGNSDISHFGGEP